MVSPNYHTCDKCGGVGSISAIHTPLKDDFWMEVRFTKYNVRRGILAFCETCWEDLWNQAVEARRDRQTIEAHRGKVV